MCAINRPSLPPLPSLLSLLLLSITASWATADDRTESASAATPRRIEPAVERSFKNTTTSPEFHPRPTCAAPLPPKLTPADLPTICLPMLAAINAIRQQQQIADALERWETASQVITPLSDEDRHVAYVLQKTKRTGHEISLALELQNPVRVNELRSRYHWRTIAATDDGILLTAEPRAAVDRLFYRSFEVVLDSRSHLPVSLRFRDRRGVRQAVTTPIVIKRKPGEFATEVRLVSAEFADDDTPSDEPGRFVESPDQAEIPVVAPRP